MRSRLFGGWLLLSLLTVGACSSGEQSASRDELAAFAQSQSMKLIKQKLRDPDSAKFENIHISWKSGQPIMCGTVNSNNGFGGKAGAQRFLSNGVDVTVLEEEVKAGEFDAVSARYC